MLNSYCFKFYFSLQLRRAIEDANTGNLPAVNPVQSPHTEPLITAENGTAAPTSELKTITTITPV